MNELFAMTFGRIFFTLAAAPATTALAIAACFSLCIIFQVTLLRRENLRTGKLLKRSHFAWTSLFIFYLLNVYRITGMGTLWSIIGNNARINMDTIHLVPFMSFTDDRLGFLFFALNIAMTVPLGLFLSALWPTMRSWKRIALAGFCFSLAIELSQLFTMRGTNVDDLIANTLGVVVGYSLFKFIDSYRARKMSDRKKAQLQTREHVQPQSSILRNEGITYVALSFLGMFLFFNSAVVANLDMQIGLAGNMEIISTNTTDPLQQESDLKGTVLEATTNSVIIELIETDEMEDGTLLAASTDDEQKVYFDNMTGIDIWRIDEFKVAIPVAIGASPYDIREGDMIDIVLREGSSKEAPAQHITVWRFP
ncbi:MAG: VanZ family protein [Coriobacteriia bacterium]|nr:VanZ family protein [Coriobacteriia bacterium]